MKMLIKLADVISKLSDYSEIKLYNKVTLEQHKVVDIFVDNEVVTFKLDRLAYPGEEFIVPVEVAKETYLVHKYQIK